MTEQTAERTGVARALPVLVASALVASWWLSLIILVESAVVDFTPPELVVLAGGVVALATRPWRWLPRVDLPLLALFGAYLAWFPLAALMRGTLADLKTAGAYLVFCSLAAAVAYAAARLRPRATARLLVGVVVAAVIVSFAAAAVERLTYPLPGQPDPLEPLWTFFRPRVGLDDPRLGYIDPPPLHAPTGEPGVIRATGFFVQTNFLAFFCVLAVPLATVALARSLRVGLRRRAALAALVLAAAIVTAYWTYARVGMVAVVAVTLAALAAEWVAAPGRQRLRPSRREARPTLIALGLAGMMMVGAFMSDGVGLSRLTGTTLGEPAPSDAPGTPGENAADTAARSGLIRVNLQRTALEMIGGDPRSLLLGTGMAAYETAVHDPASPRHLPEARGIRDPNSLWLTAGLAGGLIAVVLLAAVLAALLVRLARSIRRPADEWIATVVVWLAAWLPVWALVQLLGTNPFNTSEAVIFGTMVGLIIGLTGVVIDGDRVRSRASGDLDQA